MSSPEQLARLQEIKHIVVVMMENRSFDHMLGYLERDGLAVDGLDGSESNDDADGTPHPVFELPPDRTAFHLPGEPLDESLDPCHSVDCVAQQLENRNGGFVKNFVAVKKPPQADWNLPMGYYTGTHLPVYNFLAHEFCVCDAWHSSVPGDTWPNRLYALAGREGRPVTQHLGIFQHLLGTSLWHRLLNVPVYEVEAFTRQLADDQWRWYSHDPASLRAADAKYRNFTHMINRDNFAYFNRKEISLQTELVEELLFIDDSFLDDAATNQLRDVSWIDPNFVNLRVLDSNSNDDHPPSDVRAGQQLVLDIYDALSKTRDWPDTLLVVTYDEHGGFYDHVPPPPVHDGGDHKTYGVRVPALVIGPRVRKDPCHALFDHTSIISTIIRRFAKDPASALAKLPLRARNAEDLSVVLADSARADVSDHAFLHDQMAEWRVKAREARAPAPNGQPSVASDGAGHPLTLNEFQEGFVTFALAMRKLGLPAGRP
jgi:phospholipase C